MPGQPSLLVVAAVAALEQEANAAVRAHLRHVCVEVNKDARVAERAVAWKKRGTRQARETEVRVG